MRPYTLSMCCTTMPHLCNLVAQVERQQLVTGLAGAAHPHELVDACFQAALQEAVQRMVGEAHHQDGAHVGAPGDRKVRVIVVERPLYRLNKPWEKGRAGRKG